MAPDSVIANLKPVEHLRVYDLVGEAGVDVSDWANYKRPESPQTNPKYCYEWAFEAADRVVVCLWFTEMDIEESSVCQNLNYRAIAASRRHWDQKQRERAASMDHAIQYSRLKKVPIRVIVVDGSRRSDTDDETRSHVERRLLDPEPWHVAVYDDDGNCRLQRGPKPDAHESFTSEEIAIVGIFAEGAQTQITAKTRERSVRLRDLAREHFAKRSPDGRLRCAACDWAPPIGLDLSGPIVEIHHEVAISTLPKEGHAHPFAEAVKFLIPLCPNCHRVLHAKRGGGSFKLDELRSASVSSEKID
ncbi:MAG: hypothetical protein WC205_08000 [Opitutaceae bacterium]|jgi:5-methylcytosine-specific restriction enzyme A